MEAHKKIEKKHIFLLLYLLAVVSIGFIRCTPPLPPGHIYKSTYNNCKPENPDKKLIVNEEFGPYVYWLEKTSARSSTPHTQLFCKQRIPNTSYPFITPPNQFCVKAKILDLRNSNVIKDRANTRCYFDGKNAVLVYHPDGPLRLIKPVAISCAVTLPPRHIIGSYPNPKYDERLDGSARECLVYITEESYQKITGDGPTQQGPKKSPVDRPKARPGQTTQKSTPTRPTKT